MRVLFHLQVQPQQSAARPTRQRWFAIQSDGERALVRTQLLVRFCVSFPFLIQKMKCAPIATVAIHCAHCSAKKNPHTQKKNTMRSTFVFVTLVILSLLHAVLSFPPPPPPGSRHQPCPSPSDNESGASQLLRDSFEGSSSELMPAQHATDVSQATGANGPPAQQNNGGDAKVTPSAASPLV